MKTKKDNLIELVKLCFRIDDVLQKQKEKSDRLRRMAQLARQGMKDSDEFKALEREFKNPTMDGPSEELHELRIIVKRLRKYKI